MKMKSDEEILESGEFKKDVIKGLLFDFFWSKGYRQLEQLYMLNKVDGWSFVGFREKDRFKVIMNDDGSGNIIYSGKINSKVKSLSIPLNSFYEYYDKAWEKIFEINRRIDYVR